MFSKKFPGGALIFAASKIKISAPPPINNEPSLSPGYRCTNNTVTPCMKLTMTNPMSDEVQVKHTVLSILVKSPYTEDGCIS